MPAKRLHRYSDIPSCSSQPHSGSWLSRHTYFGLPLRGVRVRGFDNGATIPAGAP